MFPIISAFPRNLNGIPAFRLVSNSKSDPDATLILLRHIFCTFKGNVKKIISLYSFSLEICLNVGNNSFLKLLSFYIDPV